MPSALTTISRRRALFSIGALTLLGATAAACGQKPPAAEVTDLTTQLDRARADSTLAAGAAAAAPPRGSTARALNTVAAERAAHAQALADELTRMTGDTPTSTATTTPSSANPGGSTPAPSVSAVVDALQQSARGAADLAARLSGYRAGLLGSIAASCTAAYSVALGGAQ